MIQRLIFWVAVLQLLLWTNGQVATADHPLEIIIKGSHVVEAPIAPQPSADDISPALAPLDNLFTTFIGKHHVPGCSVAVADHGRLVYVRGFGDADIAGKKPVTTSSLFRIASISKPITAVAILQLVEQRKLKLDDPVFRILNYKPYLSDGAVFDDRQNQITIRQLLQHRGGWDQDKSFDPMFQSVRFARSLGVAPPAGPHDVIRCMLGQPLDFAPGERYAYSNYGYCLLGRVIESVSGQSYESYVKDHVLAPLGIRSMRLGKTRLVDRCENEVRYYDPETEPSVFKSDLGQKVPRPYGAFNLEAMDAHGGWLASAVDLVRFATVFDDPEKCPILKPQSIREMFERPTGDHDRDAEGKAKDNWYALGWSVRPIGSDGKITCWHTGSLPGTSTILIRRYDGRDIAVLFNSRTSATEENLMRALEGPLHRTLDEIKSWPETDLFPKILGEEKAK